MFSSIFKPAKQYPIASLTKISKKFQQTTNETEEEPMTLDPEDSMAYDEYEQILILLNNNQVQEANFHQTMIKMMNLHKNLGKYREYLEGWTTLVPYVEKNYEKFSHHDLTFFIEALSYFEVTFQEKDTWRNVIKHYCQRQSLSAQDFAKITNNLVYIIRGVPYGKELLENDIVPKIEFFGFNNLHESLQCMGFLAVAKFDPSHKIWKTFAEKWGNSFELTDKNKQSEFVNSAFVFSYGVGNKISGYDALLEKFKVSFFDYLNTLKNVTIVMVVTCLIECNSINDSQLSQALTMISPNVEDLPLILDARLKTDLLVYCLHHPDFHKRLGSKQIGKFPAPSDELLRNFEKHYNAAKQGGFNEVTNFYRTFEATINDEIKHYNVRERKEQQKFDIDV